MGMKNKHSAMVINKTGGLRIFRLILPLVCLLFSYCGKNKSAVEDANIWYTCSMDPQIMEKKPGNCPICKMELTKIVVKNDVSKAVHLSEDQEKLANIQTKSFRKEGMVNRIILNGVVAFNEKRNFEISARAGGRIEKLFVKTVGAKINASEPLYELYSQLILASWRELNSGFTSELPVSADIDKEKVMVTIRNRLKYLGVADEVIKKMETNRMQGTEIPFYSTQSGIVLKILVKEGDNIVAGQSLFQIANLDRLWVEASLYSMDNEKIDLKDKVSVTIEGYNKPVIGYVVSIKPEIKENTRVTLLRIEIENPDNLFKPGMKAQIAVSDQGENAIRLPEEAVIVSSGDSALVWVKTGNHIYEPRAVLLGLREGFSVGIKSGINSDDEIVVSGAYLLQSEYKYRRKD